MGKVEGKNQKDWAGERGRKKKKEWSPFMPGHDGQTLKKKA